MIYPNSIGILKKIKLGNHDGNLGELYICIIANKHIISISETEKNINIWTNIHRK